MQMHFKIKRYIYLGSLFLLFSLPNLSSMVHDHDNYYNYYNYDNNQNFGAVNDFGKIITCTFAETLDNFINKYGLGVISLFAKAKAAVTGNFNRLSNFTQQNITNNLPSIKGANPILLLNRIDIGLYNMINKYNMVRNYPVMATLKGIADQKMREVLNATAKAANDSIEQNVTVLNNVDKSYRKNLYITAGVVTGVIASYYASKYVSKYFFDKAKNAHKLPRLIVDTSINVPNQIKTEDLKSIILPKDLDDLLLKIAEFVKKTSYNISQNSYAKYSNLLIAGPRGTGKTMFTKELAKKAGLDYIRISGTSFSEFKNNELLVAINELFSWVSRNKKPLMLIIDNADLFLYKNMALESQEHNLMTAFLNNLSLYNNKFMVVMCTSNKDNFDREVLNNLINASIETRLPDEDERDRCLILYKENVLMNFDQSSKEFIESVDKVLTIEKINNIAKITAGLSYRDLEDIVNSLKLESYMQKDKVLTESIVDIVVLKKLSQDI